MTGCMWGCAIELVVLVVGLAIVFGLGLLLGWWP